MIPILFEATATNFNSMGLGILADAITCDVIEERNGEFELTMTYPETGIRFSDLRISRIILAVPHTGADAQPFRIYKITAPINGVVTVDAQHISYQLSDIPVGPFTASTVTSCLQLMASHALEPCPFTFWTDKTTAAAYNQASPESIRARLGGVRGSVLDVYGGEYEWDGYTVKLHNARGQDRGVVLRYGKNLMDLTQEETIEGTITGVVPMWVDTEGGECIYASPVYSPYASRYPYKKTRVIDFSSDFETKPTVSDLTAKAQSYIDSNNIGIPKVGIDVKFVQLWETEEYKHIAQLERVYLCDTVTVLFERLGIETTAKVTKTDYNVLLDRYNEIYLGENTHSLASTIAELDSDLSATQKSAIDKSALKRAVETATALITGESGGYVVLHHNANGYPYEILIMDTDNIATATKVWRWNNAGLGYSNHGYNGPYGLAMTQAGEIVADYIKTGELSATLVKILGSDVFFWDAANIFIKNPLNTNQQIRIGQYDGTHYGIAFTQDGGTTWVTSLDFDGGNAGALKTGYLEASRIRAGTITLSMLASAAKSNLANSEQIIYKSQAESAAAPAATTIWVTDTSGGNNTWTLVRPEYSQTYPKLYVALQRKDAAGTITCTTPAQDKTTTVIDGAHIITGSVTASQIAAETITLDKLVSSTSSGDGIVKLAGTGIEVSHTVGQISFKTRIKASGLQVLNSSDALLGGVYVPEGQSAVKMGASSLFNPSYPNFSVQLEQFHSNAEDADFYGLCLYRKGVKICGLAVQDDDNADDAVLIGYNDWLRSINDIISVSKEWANYDPSMFVFDGSDDLGEEHLIYAHGSLNVSSSEARYANYSAYRFTSTPTVVCQYSQTGGNIAGDLGALKIYNKSASGFNAIIGGSTSQPDRDVDWIAIGLGYGYLAPTS